MVPVTASPARVKALRRNATPTGARCCYRSVDPAKEKRQRSQLTPAEVDGKVVLAFVRPEVAQGVRDSLPFPGGTPKARPITREPQLSPAYQSSALPSENRSARGVCAEPAGGPDSRG